MSEIKKSEVLKMGASVEEINKAAVEIPFKINYAIQRSFAKIEAEYRGLKKAVEQANKNIDNHRTEIQKQYADKTKDKDGNVIPLIENGRYVTTANESELAVKLEDLGKEVTAEQAKIEAVLEETIDVELFQFEVSDEDQKKLDKLFGGMLIGILPLIKSK